MRPCGKPRVALDDLCTASIAPRMNARRHTPSSPRCRQSGRGALHCSAGMRCRTADVGPQVRRLNTTAVSEAFIGKHGGLIGENHVILLVPSTPDPVPPEQLAAELNRIAVSAELNRMCGSASIFVRLLEQVRLGRLPKQT